MLRPADIEGRDFLVVVHGYHKGEVREFLTEIARSYAGLLDQVQAPAETSKDDFESMGAEIAGVLRAAKEAAAVLTTDAEEALRQANEQADRTRVDAERRAEEVLAAAEALRADALRDAESLRATSEATLADARRAADELRTSAEAVLAEAHETARRVEREADERAQAHQIQAEADVRTRLDALRAHEANIRSRLDDLGGAVREAVGSLDASTADADVDLATASYQ